MRIIFIFLAILIFPTLAYSAKPYNICVPIDNAPFAFIEDDKLQGFDIDLLNSLQLDVEVEILQRDFASSIAGLGNAECDMILSNVTINEDRSKRFLFAEPHIESGLYAAVLKDSPITDIDTLQYSIVGVLKGSVGEEYAFYQFKGGVIYALRDNANILEMLIDGTIEAILESLPRLQQLQKTNNIRILEQSLFEESFAYAFAKKHEKLRDKVNIALQNLQDNGTIDTIYKKWFGDALPEKP